ncbi:MAG: aspartate oxidase, partial [Nocardioidaceae bacterium]|nr:aspartate oxidase [Nocardioidaceae bacterium]
APACHYASGGVATDLDGQSSLPGLFATGEVACSGVHGANRLASNSLLEGLVFSRRIAAKLAADGLPERRTPVKDDRVPGLVDPDVMRESEAVMTGRVGVLRNADGISSALESLAQLVAKRTDDSRTEAWQVTNLLTVSTALANAALLRQETRGSHWREDFPERDDAQWDGHIDTVLVDGELVATYHPAGVTA